MDQSGRLEWIEINEKTGAMYTGETHRSRLIRKVRENPFVPLGCFVTVAALVYGVWCLRTGNRRMSQNMMRLRVAAQGFTVFAVLGGLILSSQSKSL
ncbi:hypothetical protein KM043_003368 [Ampulex compressa]|nr:hypothetical protein KM043_003368 [Ampulex compressa]